MSWLTLGRMGWLLASAGVMGAVGTVISCKKGEGAMGGKQPPSPSIGPVGEESQQTIVSGRDAVVNSYDSCSRFNAVVESFIPSPEKHLEILLRYAQKYATQPQASSATYDADLAGIRAALIALPGGAVYFTSSNPTQIHNNIMDGFTFLNALATVQPSRVCTENDYTANNRDKTEEAVACNIKRYWEKGLSVVMRGYFISNDEFRIITPLNKTQFPGVGNCANLKFSNKIFPSINNGS